MANKQETLIYAEKEHYTEAEFMSRSFVNKEIKNRAYVNAFGAELVIKYLTTEGFDTSDLNNIHSVSKILESIDIADIMLPNIHIDVRTVFDEKQIFIPKSHFELEITPDIYVAIKLSEDFKHAELLGYFKPSQINKQHENREYYFIEKDKLSSADSLSKFIKDYTGNTSRDISEEDFLRGRELSVSLTDHNITASEEKELLELLLLSDSLRESVLEFDNFQTLSYSAAPILTARLIEEEEAISPLTQLSEEVADFDDFEEADEQAEDNSQDENLESDEEFEDIVEEDSLADAAMDKELAIDETFPEEDIPTTDFSSLQTVTPIMTEEPEIVEESVSLEDTPIVSFDQFKPVNDITFPTQETEESTANIQEDLMDFSAHETVSEDTNETQETLPTLDIVEPTVDEDIVELGAIQEDTFSSNITEGKVIETEQLEPITSAVILNEIKSLEGAFEQPTEQTEEPEETLADFSTFNPIETIQTEEILEEPSTTLNENIETEIVEEATEDATEEIAEDVAEEVIEEAVEEVVEEAVEEVVEEPTTEILEEIDEVTSEEAISEEFQVEEITNNIDEELAIEEPSLEVAEPDIEQPSDVIEDETIENTQETIQEEVLETPTEELALEESLDENIIEEPLSQETFGEETIVEDLVEEPILGELEPLGDLDEIGSIDLEPIEDIQSEEISQLEDEPIGIAEELPSLELDETPELDIKQDELGEDLLGENTIESDIAETPVEETPTEANTEEVKEEVKPEPVIEEKPQEEKVNKAKAYAPTAVTTLGLSIDSLLDQTIASIDTTEKAPKKQEIEPIDKAAEATAEALADAVAKEEAKTEEIGVSDDAIKLAGLAGDTIDDVVLNLEENQQKNLNKIDYAKTDITQEADDTAEHINAIAGDLSFAKMEANLEVEISGEFGGPTDLSNLNTVETYEEKQFVHEAVDFGAMQTISKEKLAEQGFENNNGEQLTNLNMSFDNLPDINLGPEVEEGVIDMPQFTSGLTINDDGTSSLDKMMDTSLGMEMPQEEGLMDMGSDDSALAGNLDFSSCMKPSTRERSSARSHSDKPKHVMDEATKQALLANKITREGDDEDDSIIDEDFGETITIPVDDDPIEIEAPESYAQSAEDDQELSLEDLEALVAESESLDSEAWMSDTNYENLTDVERQPEETVEDLITEPETQQKTYAAAENSSVISDKNFQTGEVAIDINGQQTPSQQAVGNVYSAKMPGDALMQNSGRLGNTSSSGKGAAGILGIIGTLIVLALIGGIGFGVMKLFKNPTEEAPQPITDGPLPTSYDNGVSDANTLNIDPNNVVNMDTPTKKAVAKTTTATAGKSSTSTKKTNGSTFIEIKKLTWEVPDYISYNQQFKQYFQSVGKSLKLTLTSDLLLATDYLYSDNVRVAVTFGKDGTFQNSQIIVSSGSNQIDKIVLQTVNQTLKALKAPNSVGNDENTTAVLKIYF